MTHLLEALKGNKPKRTPIWLMRQAGRYLPEYMAIREKLDTLSMFCTPKIAAEITLQPLKRFDLDGAILYADILLIPKSLGLGLSFQAGEGPKFQRTIRSQSDLHWLLKQGENTDNIIDSLSYVFETLQRVKPQLSQAQTLIGFAGAPWTVASYMIEGGSAHGSFLESKKLMFHQPEVLHGILSLLTDITISYLTKQVESGAQVLQLFESWGGALTPDQYQTFALPYTKKILSALQPRVPCIHFVGESAGFIEEALATDAAFFGLDWRQDLTKIVPLANAAKKGVQGNLDPTYLYASEELLEKKSLEILEKSKKLNYGYVFNLGHGITPQTPLASVGKLVDVVHSFS